MLLVNMHIIMEYWNGRESQGLFRKLHILKEKARWTLGILSRSSFPKKIDWGMKESADFSFMSPTHVNTIDCG